MTATANPPGAAVPPSAEATPDAAATSDSQLTDITSVAATVQEVDVSAELAQIEERFGIPTSTFDDFVIFRPNSKWLALANRDMELPQRPPVSGLGMPFLYPNMRYPRFTTAAAIRFGPLATRNVVDLEDPDLLHRFIASEVVPFDPGEHPLVSGPGHLLVRHRGMWLGLGNCRVGEASWTLMAMLPKTWQEML